jgi:hypothetical protein
LPIGEIGTTNALFLGERIKRKRRKSSRISALFNRDPIAEGFLPRVGKKLPIEEQFPGIQEEATPGLPIDVKGGEVLSVEAQVLDVAFAAVENHQLLTIGERVQQPPKLTRTVAGSSQRCSRFSGRGKQMHLVGWRIHDGDEISVHMHSGDIHPAFIVPGPEF